MSSFIISRSLISNVFRFCKPSDHECSTNLLIMNVLLLKLCLAVLEQIVLWVINWKTS